MTIHKARQIWRTEDLDFEQYEDDTWVVTSPSWPEHMQDVLQGDTKEEALARALREGKVRLLQARATIEHARRFNTNPMLRYSPTIQGLTFHQDAARRKVLRGPNQLSKTVSCAVEVLRDILGDPDKPQRNPHLRKRTWWVLCKSWKQSKVIQAVLREWIPAEYVNWQVCGYTSKNGWTGQYIEFTGGPWEGSWIRIKTMGQDTDELASETLTGGIWIDEPLRDTNIYVELEGRVVRHGARLIFSVTPSGDLSWLKARCVRVALNGQPAEPEPTNEFETRLFEAATEPGAISDHQFQLVHECAVTVDGKTEIRTPEQISEYLAVLPRRYIPQRRDGEWDGPAEDVAFENWDPALWGMEPGFDPELPITLVYSSDWGAMAGATVAFLLGIQRFRDGNMVRHRVHVYNEYIAKTATQMREDVDASIAMLEEALPTQASKLQLVRQVDRWYVDTTHVGSGKRGIGRKHRDVFARELDAAVAYSSRRRGDHAVKVNVVWKPPGRIKVDVHLLNSLMAAELLTVSRRCKLLPLALGTWDGTVDDRTPWQQGGQRKHLVDGLRYGVSEPIMGKKGLEAAAHRAGPIRIV